MTTTAINVNVPRELNDRLESQARARLTSKSAVIREALLRHVANYAEPRPTATFARRGRRAQGKAEVRP